MCARFHLPLHTFISSKSSHHRSLRRLHIAVITSPSLHCCHHIAVITSSLSHRRHPIVVIPWPSSHGRHHLAIITSHSSYRLHHIAVNTPLFITPQSSRRSYHVAVSTSHDHVPVILFVLWLTLCTNHVSVILFKASSDTHVRIINSIHHSSHHSVPSAFGQHYYLIAVNRGLNEPLSNY